MRATAQQGGSEALSGTSSRSSKWDESRAPVSVVPEEEKEQLKREGPRACAFGDLKRPANSNKNDARCPCKLGNNGAGKIHTGMRGCMLISQLSLVT